VSMSPSITAPSDADVSARRVAAIVGVLSLAVFMSSLDLFNGYTTVFAAVRVPAGRWADRVGRLRLFVAGLAVFSLGSLLCGLAPGVPELIGARVIQAAGAGLMVPASLSLLLAVVPAQARAQAIGTWSAIGALGAALGPVIGGSLVQLSWRWVFWINLPVGVAAILLAGRVVPESKDDEARGRPDVIGAALLAASVGLTIPSLIGAGTASLPPAHFGTGSGILNMARQVGTVLGVAGLVAILSHAVPADPLAGYRHGVILVSAFFAAAGVVSAALLIRRVRPAPAPGVPSGR
jgi:hypothetical protein